MACTGHEIICDCEPSEFDEDALRYKLRDVRRIAEELRGGFVDQVYAVATITRLAVEAEAILDERKA